MGILAVTRLGIVSAEQLQRNRRYAYLVCAVVAALLPGVDPVTMLIEMVPLLVLYELSILLARAFGQPAGGGLQRADHSRALGRAQMAKSDQHRMVFDIRGRRKNVVKVVYAVLALLMGLSLFFVTGSVSIGDLFDSGRSRQRQLNFDDQAAKIEAQLKKQPQNENLWLNLTRARYSAGNALIAVDSSTGQQQVTPDARAQFKRPVPPGRAT